MNKQEFWCEVVLVQLKDGASTSEAAMYADQCLREYEERFNNNDFLEYLREENEQAKS